MVVNSVTVDFESEDIGINVIMLIAKEIRL